MKSMERQLSVQFLLEIVGFGLVWFGVANVEEWGLDLMLVTDSSFMSLVRQEQAKKPKPASRPRNQAQDRPRQPNP